MQIQKDQKQQPQIRYLLVLDFQATCQNNVKLQPCSQIIQFPVRLIDTHSLKIIQTFHQYVKPVFNKKLTKFCTQLTGITQKQVDQGKILEDVLKDLDKWMQEKFQNKQKADGVVLINSQNLKDKNFTFVTCGDWDLMTCLRTQAVCKKIQYPDYLKQYINVKKYFAHVLGWQKQQKKSRGMMQMLDVLNIKHEGKHHSGIDDVTNICQLCIGLIQKHNAKFEKKWVVTAKDKKIKKQYVQKK